MSIIEAVLGHDDRVADPAAELARHGDAAVDGKGHAGFDQPGFAALQLRRFQERSSPMERPVR